MVNACVLVRTERGRGDDVVAKVRQIEGVKICLLYTSPSPRD